MNSNSTVMQYGDIFPNKEDKGNEFCTTYGIIANSSVGHCYFNYSSREQCTPTSENVIVESFDMQNTITTEFGLFCEQKYKVALAGSSYMAGLLIGSLLSGVLADKFGRKKTGLATLLLCGLSLKYFDNSEARLQSISGFMQKLSCFLNIVM